jgi:hypothetical protein
MIRTTLPLADRIPDRITRIDGMTYYYYRRMK